MSPFQRRFAWHISRDLDLDGDEEAARELLGEHDFASFQARRAGRATASRTSTTRTMTRSDWTEEPLAGGGRLLIYEIAGTGFLKYMVRAIVGTLVEVGDGRRSPASLRSPARFAETAQRRARRHRLPGCISFALITMRPVRYPSPSNRTMSLEQLLEKIPRGSPDESLAREINFDALPSHIAIIMDGNGRWAAQRHLPRVEGHRAGIEVGARRRGDVGPSRHRRA